MYVRGGGSHFQIHMEGVTPLFFFFVRLVTKKVGNSLFCKTCYKKGLVSRGLSMKIKIRWAGPNNMTYRLSVGTHRYFHQL